MYIVLKFIMSSALSCIFSDILYIFFFFFQRLTENLLLFSFFGVTKVKLLVDDNY